MPTNRVRSPLLDSLEHELEPSSSTVSLTPTTRHLRGKLSSLFSPLEKQPPRSPEPFAIPDFALIEPENQSMQDAAYQVEAVMCRLLSQPHHELDKRYNSMLLSIFESYRSFSCDHESMKLQLEQEIELHYEDNLKLKHAELK
ncbi:hypothetical protein AMS68_006075 [Peltaster fructicola]|uniref:Uncharacterized protein n=1 Tax=Peltaster fructicola TaxID=286661 RepID=A0A6H0Y138_9PEZI|nr:hypothetical protein AMS68_006075 [Peltaster fructicola]